MKSLYQRGGADTCARNRVRELRSIRGGGPDTSREVRTAQELSGGLSAAGCHQSDPLGMLLPHQAHRFGNVAVIAHDDRAIVDIQPAVIQEMHG